MNNGKERSVTKFKLLDFQPFSKKNLILNCTVNAPSTSFNINFKNINIDKNHKLLIINLASQFDPLFKFYITNLRLDALFETVFTHHSLLYYHNQ